MGRVFSAKINKSASFSSTNARMKFARPRRRVFQKMDLTVWRSPISKTALTFKINLDEVRPSGTQSRSSLTVEKTREPLPSAQNSHTDTVCRVVQAWFLVASPPLCPHGDNF